jgi:hypothetical protein
LVAVVVVVLVASGSFSARARLVGDDDMMRGGRGC